MDQEWNWLLAIETCARASLNAYIGQACVRVTKARYWTGSKGCLSVLLSLSSFWMAYLWCGASLFCLLVVTFQRRPDTVQCRLAVQTWDITSVRAQQFYSGLLNLLSRATVKTRTYERGYVIFLIIDHFHAELEANSWLLASLVSLSFQWSTLIR